MEFKDRFKGRTTVVTKEGVLNTLAAPSNNPVHKSQSNVQINSNSFSKNPTPFPQNEIQCNFPHFSFV